MPRDNGRVLLVITEGPHNRLFWIEADPFRVLQAAALTVSGEEIQIGPVKRELFLKLEVSKYLKFSVMLF